MLTKWFYAWLVLLAVALLAGAFALGYKQGKAVCEGQWRIAENALLNEALQMRNEYEQVINESKEKQKAIFVDFSDVTESLIGLRESAESGVSADSIAAANHAARIRGELLAECAKEYVGVAKYADIHALDAQTCYNAWNAMLGK